MTIFEIHIYDDSDHKYRALMRSHIANKIRMIEAPSLKELVELVAQAIPNAPCLISPSNRKLEISSQALPPLQVH